LTDSVTYRICFENADSVFRTSYTYDNASRRTNVDNLTSAGAAIAKFAYKYDAASNPTSLVESSGDRVTWSYDVADQLIAERRSGASAYANTFTYDSVGNRTLKNANSIRTTFNYDSANQLTYSLAAAGRTTFNYDQAGNQHIEQPPTGARTTTTWNYENQPNVYQLPSATRMTLAYNADNRRVSKVTASGTTKFIWDPASDAYQSELDGSNVTQVVYTSPPSQFGQLISQRRSSTSRWYHPDSLGSTRALTDSVQATTDTYLCDAWGNPLSSTGSTVNPFRGSPTITRHDAMLGIAFQYAHTLGRIRQ
jgi:YD repeat-containing protein